MKRKSDIAKLRTERRNPVAARLDTLSAREIARLITREDAKVAGAVRRALPAMARAIEAIAGALARGGRLIYVGAGTSGRIAALDAAECPPTFGTSPRSVQYMIAGGRRALDTATEGSEDSPSLGRRDLARRKPSKRDVVVGVAASGRTPYTLAALQFARRRGAHTVAVTCNPGSPLARAAHIAIVTPVGPEAVAGSSRMKAGTAQKMVLNLLSTGAMARLGYVYGNLMVNVPTKNRKLVERGLSILEAAAGVSRKQAQRALRAAGMSVPVALIMLKAGLSRAAAQRRLRLARGHVRRAIEEGS
ncbi:MAG TPA: N-acetylmuramic acid 6-phosphate etherase [Terriglobales bacterium]|jgi:N-acetylmuramic acid 6-phosphate etherase|nr:N-acetylmuramic acid 6-phosphate etherase [Terriglobales bacterium]